MHKLKEALWRWRRLLVAIGVILTAIGLLDQALPRLLTKPVVVAKKEIIAGETISAQQVTIKEIPLRALGSDTFPKLSTVLGKESALRIPAGTVLISSMLQGPSQLAKRQIDQVVITVEVADSDFSLVQPGAQIQFFITEKKNKEIKPDLSTDQTESSTKIAIPATVLSNIKVDKTLTTLGKSYLVVAVKKKYSALLLEENRENTLRLAVY